MFTKDTLTNLDIFLGDKCNLKCIHCPCWLERDPLELDADVLWSRVDEALSYVERECARFDRSMIIGGEPFSHARLADYLCEQSFDHLLTVYTNFAHQLPERDWPKNVGFITSMDAADDATYRQTRRTRDFPTVHANLMRNAPWIIHADTTVSRLNYQRLESILALSGEIGCTHWFLPIDPRLLRYAAEHTDDIPTIKTAERVSKVLLDEEILQSVRGFFERHAGDERINDYGMFHGLYLSGSRHFDDLEEYAVEEKKQKISSVSNCPGGERYLEITFDFKGRFVPVLYCPGLKRRFPAESVPRFERFADLMEWQTSAFTEGDCLQFCARTQFLGIDDYKDHFSDIQVVA